MTPILPFPHSRRIEFQPQRACKPPNPSLTVPIESSKIKDQLTRWPFIPHPVVSSFLEPPLLWRCIEIVEESFRPSPVPRPVLSWSVWFCRSSTTLQYSHLFPVPFELFFLKRKILSNKDVWQVRDGNVCEMVWIQFAAFSVMSSSLIIMPKEPLV